MNRTICCLLLLTVLAPVFPGALKAADKGILLTEDVQLKLADSFMSEHEYYRAVTEYKAFLILFPDSDQADSVLFKIGRANYLGDELEMAVRAFSSVCEKYPDGRYASAAGYHAGLSCWKLNRLDDAVAAFTVVATRYSASSEAPRSLLEKSIVEFDRKDIPGSRQALEQFLAAYPGNELAAKVRDTISLLDRNLELPHKSPLAAGVLSAIVPGAGHVYAGHYVDGLTSFCLNGLFIAGTIAAVKNENYAEAGVVGVIGLPFYIGNIYGAANAATKWNVSIGKDLRNTIAVSLGSEF